MQTVVVTGAARGIGLEFCRQYLERGDRVFAGYRRKETAGKLFDLQEANAGRLSLISMDVGDQRSIQESRRLCEAAGATQVDVLVNNAGLGGIARATGKQERLGTFDFEDAWVVLRTMAVGPLLMAQAYLDLMKRSPGAKIANVTSGYGSIGRNDGFPYYYSAAKAAMHQFMRSLAKDIRQWNISVVLLDPGSVRTDMGGPNAPVGVDESVGGMVQRIDAMNVHNSGAFVSWDNHMRDW